MHDQNPDPVPDPEEPEVPSIISEVFFGDPLTHTDLTSWLNEYVRTSFAEHFSRLSDDTPKAAIPILIALTIKGISDANEAATDLPEPPPDGWLFPSGA